MIWIVSENHWKKSFLHTGICNKFCDALVNRSRLKAMRDWHLGSVQGKKYIYIYWRPKGVNCVTWNIWFWLQSLPQEPRKTILKSNFWSADSSRQKSLILELEPWRGLLIIIIVNSVYLKQLFSAFTVAFSALFEPFRV